MDALYADPYVGPREVEYAPEGETEQCCSEHSRDQSRQRQYASTESRHVQDASVRGRARARGSAWFRFWRLAVLLGCPGHLFQSGSELFQEILSEEFCSKRYVLAVKF